MVEEIVKYKLVYESPVNITPIYYWIWKFIKDVIRPNGLWKITDWHRFAKRTQEWGSMTQKKTYQIEEANKLLQTIGALSKNLVSMYKELQRIKEALDLYEKGKEPGELELKGLWADVVDARQGNPGSMVNLEKNLQFFTLRDWFFHIDADTPEKVEEVVNKLDTTERLKVVLKRKLIQYLTWKEHWKESLEELKRHLEERIKSGENSIKMYKEWARPIIRDVEGLQMRFDTKDPRIFEMGSSLISRIELVAFKGFKEDWETIKKKLEEEKLLDVKNNNGEWDLIDDYIWFNDLCDYGKYVIVIKVIYDILESTPQGQWSINEIKFVGELYKVSEFIKQALEWEKDPYDRWFDKVIEPLVDYKEEFNPEDEKKSKFKKPSNLAVKFKLFFGKLEDKKKEAKEDLKSDAWKLYNIFKKSRGMVTWE